MPAIKGDMYINTHCNYSQPTLIKLDNENIGGHLTPLQPNFSTSAHFVYHKTTKITTTRHLFWGRGGEREGWEGRGGEKKGMGRKGRTERGRGGREGEEGKEWDPHFLGQVYAPDA